MERKILFNEKIFVAGAKGMAGSAIHRLLKKRGYGKIYTPSRMQLNLTNQSAVRNWFKINNPDIVIIGAAKVGGIFANSNYPADFILENLTIQTNIIKTAWENNVKKLLFLGSSCIYPKHAKQPINEEELLKGELEETNQWYAIAKIAGIKLCESLNMQYQFNSISLMPTNLYGTGDNYHPQNSHVLASLIKRFHDASLNNDEVVCCWGTGNPLREFMHVDDLAEACLFALEHWEISNKTAPKDINGNPLYYLNVGTGKDISIKELANLIADLVGFKGKIKWDLSRPDGTPKKQLNISRINKLGWEPKISLVDGLKKTIEEYSRLSLERN